MESLDNFRQSLFTGTERAFGLIGQVYGRPYVPIIASLIAIAFFVVTTTIGLHEDNYVIESDVDELWIQRGTRMEPERDFHANSWGVPNQHFIVMSNADNVNGSANTKSLDALIESMKGMLVFDESSKCTGYDGTTNGAVIEAKCASLSAAVRNNSLYCMTTCNKIAGKGATPISFIDSQSNKSIDERHLCNTLGRADPDAEAFLPSTLPASPAYVPEFKTTSKYPYALAALLPATHPGVMHTQLAAGQQVWGAHRAIFANMVYDEIKNDQATTIQDNALAALKSTLAMVNFTQYNGGSFTATETMLLQAEALDVATTAVANAILAAYGSWLPKTYGGEGNAIGFGYQELAACAADAVALPPSSYKVGVYMGLLGISLSVYGSQAAAITAAEGAALASLKTAIPLSTTQVYTTIRDSSPASPAQTWSEKRGCPIVGTAAPTPPPAAPPAMLVTAGGAAVGTYFGAGGDVFVGSSSMRTAIRFTHPSIHNLTDAQASEVLLGLVLNSQDILAQQRVILREAYGIVLTSAETGAVTVALGTFAAVGGNMSAFDYFGAVDAAVADNTTRARLKQQVAEDLGFLFQLNSFSSAFASFATNLGGAVVKAPIASMSYNSIRVYFEIATVGFTARPLPRNWGIDRFPCTVASVTDVFREGDYALPYNIKKLGEVSLGVAGYLRGYSGLGLPDCGAQAVSGGLEAVYSQSLGADYSSDALRSGALKQAECAMGEGLMEKLGTATVEQALNANANDLFTPSVVALAMPVAKAYFEAGGSVFDCGNDAISTIQGAVAASYPGFQYLNSLVFTAPGPVLTMTAQEVGASMFALFATLMLETAGTGDVTKITDPAAWGRLGMAFTATHNPSSVAHAAALSAGFMAAMPALLQCGANINATAYQCSATCPGVAVKRVEAAQALCSSDVACQQAAAATFMTAVNDTSAYSQYGQYFVATATAFSQLPVVGGLVQSLATAAASGLALEVQAGDQLVTLASTVFVGMGHRYRPTYGSHRTVALLTDATISDELKAIYKSNVDEAVVEVLPTISDALRAYYLDTNDTAPGRQRISATACISTHKFADGTPLRGCILTWLSTWLPPDLVVADFDFGDANASVLDEIGDNGVTRMGYHRTVLSNYASGHWLGKAVLDDYLNETTDTDRRYSLHLALEEKLVDFLHPKWGRETGSGFGSGETYASEQFDFNVASATSNVVAGATNVDWTPIIICVFVMVAMVALAMTSFESNVESHFWVGIAGMVIMVMSTLTAMGSSGWIIGIPFTPLSTRVAPFIILGIGIDDMLVIAKALINHSKSGHDVATIMRHTLAESGPSVTFTTITNLTAFWIASTFRINIVKWFCQLMCVAVVVNWLFLFLLFVPVIALDSLRVKRGIPEFCCPRSPTAKKYLDVSYFVKTYYGPFLMHNATRAVVVAVFLFFFVFQLVYGLMNITSGLRNSDVLPTGTNTFDFFDLSEEYFGAYTIDLVTDSRAFDNNQTQIDIQMAAKAMAGSKWVTAFDSADADTYIQTIAEYADASKLSQVAVTAPLGCGVQKDPFNTTGTYTVIAKDEFYYAFAAYLKSFGVFGASAFICENTTTHAKVNCFDLVNAYPAVPNRSDTSIHTKDVILVAAYNSMYLRNQLETEDIIDTIKEIRETTDACYTGKDHTSFTTGYTHLYWDQYLHTYDEFLRVVGFAILGVFVVTFLFQFSFRSSFLIALVVLMVVVEMFAVIPEGSMQLNAFSVCNLAISVGLAIELTAHTVHQFLAERGEKKERVIKALEFMAWPMIFGGLTTLITSAFLATSEMSFIRQYYFEMFFAITMIALANGIILVPVLLSFPYIGDSSLIGDDLYKENHDDDVEMKQVDNDKDSSNVAVTNAYGF